MKQKYKIRHYRRHRKSGKYAKKTIFHRMLDASENPSERRSRVNMIAHLIILDMSIIWLVTTLIVGLPTPTYSFSSGLPVRAESVEEGHHDLHHSEDSVANGGTVDPSGTIEAMIRDTFPEDPDTAVAVAKCESRLDPTRYGDTHLAKPSIGVFQINQIWHKYSDETLLDPVENIRIAREIYDSTGGNFGRWSCYRFGFYEKYL